MQTPRERPGDSEKITINLGYVDLGRVDLLVREGFYANRSDLIRTAIRNQIAAHGEAVAGALDRGVLELGLRDYGRAELEAAAAAGRPLRIRVVGLVRIADDVTPDLARAGVETLTVLGALQAPAAVKAALADRTRLN